MGKFPNETAVTVMQWTQITLVAITTMIVILIMHTEIGKILTNSISS